MVDLIHMTEEERIRLALEVMPSLGYFGAGARHALNLPINAVIDQLVVKVEAPGPDYLNVGSFQFFNERGEELPRADICRSVILSSGLDGQRDIDVYSSFAEGRLIHSGREPYPMLCILFHAPVKISCIKIHNREDVYGGRSRWLHVDARIDGDVVSNFYNLPIARIDSELQRALSFLPRDIHPSRNPGSVAISVLNAIKGKIDKGENELTEGELIQFLPVHKPSFELCDAHITIIAHILIERWGDRAVLETQDARIFQHVLSSDFRIENLKREMERLIARYSQDAVTVVIGRHQIHRSRLIARRDAYIAAMQQVIAVLDANGVTSVLGYGTLLGAVRECSFLAHDDDVDLIVFCNAESQQEADVERRRIIAILEAGGLAVLGNEHWHVQVQLNDVVVDVFPAWANGSEIVLPMEGLRFRGVPRADMLPPSRVHLYGVSFPAPAHPDRFLANRYGKGWLRPDPYHEWLWPIHRVTYGQNAEALKSISMRAASPRRAAGRLSRVAWGQRVKHGDVVALSNCLFTISTAKDAGFDAVELDVRCTADGVAVLAHDDRLHGPEADVDVTKAVSDVVTRFELGSFNGQQYFVPTLAEALAYALERDLDVQLDPRMRIDDYDAIVRAVEGARYPASRLQFCVYGAPEALFLREKFPRSVLLYKTYRGPESLDRAFFDEAAALGMDGVMLPLSPEGNLPVTGIAMAKARGLRVLVFIHSRGAESDFEHFSENGVDYVTTIRNDLNAFLSVSEL